MTTKLLSLAWGYQELEGLNFPTVHSLDEHGTMPGANNKATAAVPTTAAAGAAAATRR